MEGTLENILAHVAAKGGSRTVLIEIYLKEQMFDAALEEVMAYNSIQRLKVYHKKLANMYPNEYFEAYRELIYPFAECRTGREHYRDVASIREDMKEIKGFESDVQEIVERQRRENKRKPAFIDELKAL